MSVSTPCPTSERLEHLLSGNLAALDEAAVAEHLCECVVCQRRLEERAAAGEINPELLRQLRCDDRPPNDSAYWPALDKVKHSMSSSVTVAQPDDTETESTSAVSFLQPSERPGALGMFAEFEIIRVIGRGGMGIVYEAIDPCLERRVALKVLDPKYAKDDVARQRFCREARAAAAVTHENVVIIHSVNEHSVEEVGDLPYLVMQYVQGESLQDRIDRSRPSVAEAVAIGRQVASGLAAAHQRGLIHRDVKPANVLITHDEYLTHGDPTNVVALSSMHHVKLTDFGLARAVEDVSLTQTGFVPGTPQYMAPEQARGETLDHRSDLFSLGGVLYSMVTGKVPFQGSTPYLVLRQVTEEMPAPIKEQNPETPEWLAAIIDKLLAKKPEDRFQSAAEVASLLFEGEARLLFCPVHGVKLPSGLARVTAPVRQKTSTWLPIAMALVGVAVGAGVIWPIAANHSLAPTATVAQPQFDGQSGAVWSVAFSPDNSLVAMSSEDGTVRLWNREDESVLGSITEHRGPVWSISFNPQGDLLATGGDDGYVRLWSIPGRVTRGSQKLSGSVRSVQFTADGKSLLTGTRDGSVVLLDSAQLETETMTKGHSGVAYVVAASKNNKTFASAGTDRVIRVWDAESGQEKVTLTGHKGPIYGIAMSPDGNTLVSCGWDHTVRLWDIVKGGTQIGEMIGHTEDVWSVDFSPDGKHVASAGQDKTIKVWDAKTGTPVKTFYCDAVMHTVKFSNDGKMIVAGGRDGMVKIWPAP